MQQKDSPRDENRFVFMWHLHTCGRMQILDGTSFGTSRVGRFLVSVVGFAHTCRAIEYKCEKKMESTIVQLAKEKTISYSSHISDCHNGSRVLVWLIQKAFTMVREMRLTCLRHQHRWYHRSPACSRLACKP